MKRTLLAIIGVVFLLGGGIALDWHNEPTEREMLERIATVAEGANLDSITNFAADLGGNTLQWELAPESHVFSDYEIPDTVRTQAVSMIRIHIPVRRKAWYCAERVSVVFLFDSAEKFLMWSHRDSDVCL